MESIYVQQLFVLLCGFEILPKTVSTRGRGGRFILSEPVCAYLLDTRAGWVLLDAGLNVKNARDAARIADKFCRFGRAPPVVRDVHLILSQFRELRVSPEDIQHIALSHLHYDHAGNLDLFPRAQIHVQRREHAHAFSVTDDSPYFRDEYDAPSLQWVLHDGDWELMPGVRFINTPGHTSGHQSALIDLAETGTVILPFDAGDLQENFDEEVLPGACMDEDAALMSIRRINALRRDHRALLLLFHDPVAIQQMRLSPDGYR